MDFDPYFMVTPDKGKLSSNLKKDSNLSRNQIDDFLLYLDNLFGVTFLYKEADDCYEYVFEIIFYIVVHQYENYAAAFWYSTQNTDHNYLYWYVHARFKNDTFRCSNTYGQ